MCIIFIESTKKRLLYKLKKYSRRVIVEKLIEKNISILKLGRDVIEKLLKNNIDTLLKLCNVTRIQLSNLNFSKTEINEIIVSLQLLGLDLKKNHAKKNTLIKDLIERR